METRYRMQAQSATAGVGDMAGKPAVRAWLIHPDWRPTPAAMMQQQNAHGQGCGGAALSLTYSEMILKSPAKRDYRD
jgi:hypothetical protein